MFNSSYISSTMHPFKKKIDKQFVKELAILNIFILFVIIPFLAKPIHIDDTSFIYMAEQIQKDPLRPYSFVIVWGGSIKTGTEYKDTPLMAYYIAFILTFFGESELLFHAFFLIFPVIAGNTFYFLAKRFLKKPLIPSLLLVSTPTFMVMSHSLMLDIPVLAFSLLSILFFLKGIDNSNNFFLFLGGLFAGIAYLSKPTAIVLLPILLLYILLKQRYIYALYLLIPVSIISLWAFHNFFLEDSVPLIETLPWFLATRDSLPKILAYLFSNLGYIGGATIFPFFFVWPFIKKKIYRNFWLLTVLFSILISVSLYFLSTSFISGQYSFLELFLFTLFISSFLFFLVVLVGTYLPYYRNITKERILKHSDHLFLSLWLIGVFIFNSFIIGGAARYNTLFLPPLVIVYFTILNKHLVKKTTLLLVTLLASTLLMGYAVSYADYQYATSYKKFVEDNAENYAGKVWFLGHHGFQYYMERHGFMALLSNSKAPSKDDIIIKADIPSPGRISPELQQRITIQQIVQAHSDFPIRIQNPDSHAGFYTYGGGFLPFSISKGPLETFTIYKVEENAQ